MTFAEMKSRAEILYESIDSSDAPGFTQTEWGEIFTQAQYEVVNGILEQGAGRNAPNRRALDAIIKMVQFSDTVENSKTGVITAYSDYSGTVAGSTKVTCTGHGLLDGEYITISGTTAYDGVFQIGYISANEFYIITAFDTDEATGTWKQYIIRKHPRQNNWWLVEIENTATTGIDDASDLWWILTSFADVEDNSIAYADIKVVPITWDEYQSNKSNPFRKPDRDEEFWYVLDESALVVITGGEDLKKLRVEYVENLEPYAIASGNDCVLHESIHPAIVKKAVEIAHTAVQDEKGFQLQVLENQRPNVLN